MSDAPTPSLRTLIAIAESLSNASPEQFHEVMRQEVANHVENTWCKTPEDISAGMCANFAAEVMRAMGVPEFGSRSQNCNPFINSTKWFWDDGDRLDLEKVRALREPVPEDTPRVLTARELGSVHYWLTYSGRHYDAEALEGVDHFLDLPFFQRIIQRLKAGR